MAGGTSARVRVKLGEMTAAAAEPGDEQADDQHPDQRGCRTRCGASTATTRIPLIITTSATTVSRRWIRETSRPAIGAVIAAPIANGVSRKPGLERRQPARVLEVDRQHEEDPGEPGEVQRADRQAAGVPRQRAQQRHVEQRRAAPLPQA